MQTGRSARYISVSGTGVPEGKREGEKKKKYRPEGTDAAGIKNKYDELKYRSYLFNTVLLSYNLVLLFYYYISLPPLKRILVEAKK